MTAYDDRHSAIARTDAAGRLEEADRRIIDLFERAGGGGIGAPIPLPPLAALERLARRLGIAVTRVVTVGDDDETEFDVRAEPDGAGVVLHMGGWRTRGEWPVDARPDTRERDFIQVDADLTWEADAALHLVAFSTHVDTLDGAGPETALGRPLTEVFALDGDTDGAFPILGAVAARTGFDRQSARIRSGGRRVYLSARPKLDPSGRFAGYVGAAEVLWDDAGVADDMFAAGIGARLDRALRLPIQRIIANAGSMSAQVDGPLDERYTGYAEDIATAGRHLLGLVDDLVDLEAVERPDFAVELEPIDFAEVARRAAGLMAVRAGDGEVRIDRPSADLRVPATAEFRRALQVLVNLIGNAVRYSPPGGTVRVLAERDSDRARVIVADRGRGIDPIDHGIIFEKFGRVDPSEAGGSGLGLYISRRLARAMGGDLTVDSASGDGARFIFTLPVR